MTASQTQSSSFEAALESLMLFYAPDVVCYPAPGWVEAKVCRGHDGIRALGAVWTERCEDAGMRVHEVRDMHESLLILAEFTGRDRRSGVPVAQRFAVINSDLREDGRVGEARFFLGWDAALEYAGLPR